MRALPKNGFKTECSLRKDVIYGGGLAELFSLHGLCVTIYDFHDDLTNSSVRKL